MYGCSAYASSGYAMIPVLQVLVSIILDGETEGIVLGVQETEAVMKLEAL